ncbi:MAG TPA: NADH-quinone oxidoreductase subunit NuoE [Burkholderiaceae bacterium]|nr:NADH-quinone oxidoreductase subunit NuoE [Burkholderiaceae bacterium]
MNTLLSEGAWRRIDREVAKFPADQKQSAVMAALAIAQDEIGWVSQEVVDAVAGHLQMPAIAVWEVATFYNMYSKTKPGRFKLAVCTNLPCQLRDGEKAARYLQDKLGIGFGETTPDGTFTLVEAECLGACGDAPVLLVNNKRMCSFMGTERLDALVDELKKA